MILSQNIGFSDAGHLDRYSEVTKSPLIIIIAVAQAVVTGRLRGLAAAVAIHAAEKLLVARVETLYLSLVE